MCIYIYTHIHTHVQWIYLQRHTHVYIYIYIFIYMLSICMYKLHKCRNLQVDMSVGFINCVVIGNNQWLPQLCVDSKHVVGSKNKLECLLKSFSPYLYNFRKQFQHGLTRLLMLVPLDLLENPLNSVLQSTITKTFTILGEL